MKNIHDQRTREELLSRIDKLSPATRAVWGKMSVMQGLRHMTMGVIMPTGDMQIKKVKSPMPKFLMKMFLLNFKPPRERAETFSEMNMVANNIVPDDFETERNALKNAIRRVGESKDYIPETPMSIKMSPKDWAKLVYNHTDHHLRQFGV